MAEELRRTGKKKFLRRLTRVLIVVIALLGGIHLFLLFAISPVLGEVLKNSVRTASKEHYTVEYDRLNFNILTRSIKINNLKLKPDTALFARSRAAGTAPPNMVDVEAKQLRIRNIDIWKAWRGNELRASEIQLRQPRIILHRNLNEVKDSAAVKFNPNDLLPEGYNGLYVKNIKLDDGEITLKLFEDKPAGTPLKIENIWISLADFHIDSTTINGNKPLFATDHMELKVREYSSLLSDSVHRVTVGEVQILKNNIHLNNISLKPDSVALRSKKLPAFSYVATVPKITLASVDFYKILDEKDIRISSIKVQQPQVKLFGKNSKNKQKKETAFDLAKLLPKSYSSLLVEEIVTEGGKLSWVESKSTHPVQVGQWQVKIKRLFIDTATAAQDNRFFYTDTIAVQATAINHNLPDNKYKISIPGISFNSATRYLQINKLSFEPRQSKEAFFKNVKHQTDRITMAVSNIQVSGVNAIALVRQSKIIASQVSINNLKGEVFRDKRLPPKPGHRPLMPQQMLRELPMAINIAVLKVNNADLRYEEHSPGAKTPGVATVKNMHATISNITNDAALMKKSVLKVDMTAAMMGTGRLNASLNMPLGDPRGRFSVKGSLGNMAFADLNPMMEPAMGLRIQSGQIEKMEFTAEADDDMAHGNMRFYYNNLKVQITNKETGKTTGLKESLTSLIANALVIQSDNPKNNKPLRVGIIKFQRDKSKSFINYGWNMVLSGVISSLGVPEDMQEKQQERKEKKEERQEKKEQKKEERQEKKEERQEKREEKKENRQEKRQERREQRQPKADSTVTKTEGK